MTDCHPLSRSGFSELAFWQKQTQKNKNKSKTRRGFLILRDRESLDTSPSGGWGRKNPGKCPIFPRGASFFLKSGLLCYVQTTRSESSLWLLKLVLPRKVPRSSFDCLFWGCLGVTPLWCWVLSPRKPQGAWKLSLSLVNPSASQTTRLRFSWEAGS